MEDYPLNIHGLILKIQNPNTEYRWVAPYLTKTKRTCLLSFHSSDLICKIQTLIDCEGRLTGKLMPNAACVCMAHGRIEEAKSFMRIFLGVEEETDFAIAKARRMVNDVRIKIRRLFNKNREWPKGVWNLHDVPAWLIPYFIKKFRKLVSKKSAIIISGGHLLSEGIYEWKFGENSNFPKYVVRLQ